ncbi:MAG TPA: universal stress protein, partial [Prosthecobacter sp.]|nr:universal stress protein [Prosthecobacter sp.]
MTNYKTILVAVDFSTGSRAALNEACRLSIQHGAKLQVLHVVDSMAVAALLDSHGGVYEKQAEVAARGASTALARWLDGVTLPENYEATVAVGVPLHEIMEHLSRWQADLLVAGVVGAGGVQPGAGSIASKLARKAPGRVLLVSAHAPFEFRRIVACIDFSDASRAVAAEAQRVAVMEHAHVDFLHVWQEPWLMMSYDAPVADATTEFRDSYIKDLRQMLKEFVKESTAAIKYDHVMINGANHGQAIAEHAKETKADLIIVGGKGRTNLRYVLLGSTA